MKSKSIKSKNEKEKLIEYMKKINHKFIKNPNFKYKSKIINFNFIRRNNDIFEIYTSYKDMKLYIASPNKDNNNIDIFSLLDKKKIISLERKSIAKNESIKYFFNKNNCNEYLVSIDEGKSAYIWDISNNYQFKYKINYNCSNCILIFLDKNNDYIITSQRSSSLLEFTSTTLYSFKDCSFIHYLDKTNEEQIYYLLYWYNNKDNKNYIIQLAQGKILIHDFLANKLCEKLVNDNEGKHSGHESGFIYNKDNIDYLCVSSSDGLIDIWDLSNKTLFKIFKNIGSASCMIRWNYKYILYCDIYSDCIKVFDLENEKVISKIKRGEKYFICIKKFYHPIYGESLLTADTNGKITLWII